MDDFLDGLLDDVTFWVLAPISLIIIVGIMGLVFVLPDKQTEHHQSHTITSQQLCRQNGGVWQIASNTCKIN